MHIFYDDSLLAGMATVQDNDNLLLTEELGLRIEKSGCGIRDWPTGWIRRVYHFERSKDFCPVTRVPKT